MSKRNLNRSMDTLFPQHDSSKCRVCNRDVVDGRWNYCSDRCREIAQAVQKMFIWDCVRDKILERDGYTCQNCGLSKEMAWRAYWQTQELVHGYIGMGGCRLPEKATIDSPNGLFHVDHITPISKGGHPFDESNLQTLCRDCHTTKTAEENSGRQRGEGSVSLEDYI